jgi:hypothetical protein
MEILSPLRIRRGGPWSVIGLYRRQSAVRGSTLSDRRRGRRNSRQDLQEEDAGSSRAVDRSGGDTRWRRRDPGGIGPVGVAGSFRLGFKEWAGVRGLPPRVRPRGHGQCLLKCTRISGAEPSAALDSLDPNARGAHAAAESEPNSPSPGPEGRDWPAHQCATRRRPADCLTTTLSVRGVSNSQEAAISSRLTGAQAGAHRPQTGR